MNKRIDKQPVRDRILRTASDLFYRQGYRATGINQIIAESGVAKASFYDHFPSKEDLLYAYARATSDTEMDELRRDVITMKTARERFFGPLNILTPWFESSEYRGCPFQNLVSEAPAGAKRVHDVARIHREKARVFFRELIVDLITEEPDLKDVDVHGLADMYVVLFEGTIATAVAFRESWPVTRTIEALEILLNQYRTSRPH